MRARVGLLVVVLAGCQGRESLVDHALWTPLAEAEDPAPDRPATVDCPPSAWFVEPFPVPALEVDTGTCSYLAVAQPTLTRVRGGTLHLRFGHGELVADAPAEAHFAVYLADRLAFEQVVAIPSPAEDYEVTVEELASAEAGAPIAVHLHNHGANAWSIAELSTGR